MNLFEMLEANRADAKELTRELLVLHLKNSTTSGHNKPDIQPAGLNTIQTAILLSYAGNMEHVLSDNEYTQLATAVNKAMNGWNARIRPDDTTLKITTPVVKYGNLL